MAWPAALSGAALRVLRSAAGRRALHGVLLVGGLFALGILFGGQAQAADGASAPTASPPQLSLPAPTATDANAGAEAGTAPPTPSIPVGAKVVRSTGELVAAVTEELAEAQVDVPSVASPSVPLSSVPTRPSLPSLPSFPELPDAPELPSLPSLPTLPGEQQGGTLPAPGASTPEPGSAVTPSPDRHGTAVAAVTSPYGPRGAMGTAEAGAAVGHGDDHRAAHLGQAPAHRAPAEGPHGALGNAPVADSGSPRHGDAHAVTPYDHVPLRLVPGGAVGTDAAETQDRYRDIPVFPG
ncbi:hypothetical protein ACIHAR_16125 [Streptomyces sp. NPDC052016]|uniref:hypothetical protein n=1 Tax=unclassified Streptomyces TaxID=2593676 RepID=UPI00341EA915